MQLVSSAFRSGERIPLRFTCEGENVSPELYWKEAPDKTKSFALILHDPDAPGAGGFTHWVLYNIPAERRHLAPTVPREEEIPGTGTQGINDAGQIGYTGPCPPFGTHRYYLHLFALDSELRLPPGLAHAELTAAMEGHTLEQAELMGTYARRKKTAA